MAISTRQNEPQATDYLAAIRSANKLPVLIDSVRGLAALGFVVGSVVLAFNGATSPVYAAAATVWAALAAAILSPWAKKRSTEAAAVQEAFDRHVFELGASSRADRVEPERLHEFVKIFKGNRDDLKDWYPNPDRLQRPFNVLLCQRSNLFYDIRLRQRWSIVLTVLLVAWTIVGVAVGTIAGVSVGQFILRWFAPSLPAIVFAVEAIRAQRETVSERQALLARVNDALVARGETLTARRRSEIGDIVENVQDGIYDTRCQTSRVPSWFYDLFRKKDNEAMRVAAQQFD